jgi:galactokinase
MDQLASLACTTGHALFLDTRSLESEQVPLDPSEDGLALLVVDTRVHHALGDGSYADRRAACAEAAGRLGVRSLREVPADGLDHRLEGLPDELCRRARHVVRENERVLAAVDAIRARDWAALGVLLDGSHASLRDDYQVSCAELDAAVATAVDAGALGARMTGGGFGGSAVALVPHERVTAVRTAVADAFTEAGWASPRTFEVAPSAGAGRDL